MEFRTSGWPLVGKAFMKADNSAILNHYIWKLSQPFALNPTWFLGNVLHAMDHTILKKIY
jgi:hypothetical protein